MTFRCLLPVLGLSFSLGGCAAVGLAPAVVEAVRETAAMGGYTDAQFPPAAEEACRARAARYGRVEITHVEPQDANTIRVYGTVDRFAGSEGRTFACLFRRDGHIRYFKLSREPRAAPNRT